MYCTQCGKPMEATANFCPACGQESPESRGRRTYATRRLYRSRYDKKIGGVCGGLAEYMSVDPTLIRVIVLTALICSGGVGILPYFLAWIIVPEEPILLREARPASVPV